MYALFFINLYSSLTFVGIFSDDSELKLGVKKLWSWFYDGSDGEKLNEFSMNYNDIKVATIKLNDYRNYKIKNYFNNEEEAYDDFFYSKELEQPETE